MRPKDLNGNAVNHIVEVTTQDKIYTGTLLSVYHHRGYSNDHAVEISLKMDEFTKRLTWRENSGDDCIEFSELKEEDLKVGPNLIRPKALKATKPEPKVEVPKEDIVDAEIVEDGSAAYQDSFNDKESEPLRADEPEKKAAKKK